MQAGRLVQTADRYARKRAILVGGRDAACIIVTSSVVLPLLAFSYLEYRAHRDA